MSFVFSSLPLDNAASLSGDERCALAFWCSVSSNAILSIFFCRNGTSAAAIALNWNCVQVSWERTTSTNVGSESGMPGQVTPGYGAVKWNRISLVEVGAPGLLCEEELRYVASPFYGLLMPSSSKTTRTIELGQGSLCIAISRVEQTYVISRCWLVSPLQQQRQQHHDQRDLLFGRALYILLTGMQYIARMS